MRLIPLLCAFLLLLLCQPLLAGQKSVTLYLDGARVEQDVVFRKRCLELPLPDNFVPGSLRVMPVKKGRVLRVEIASQRDPQRTREISRLEERKQELQARLEALSAREEIFTAAAKTQSGKAPRMSKLNPEPLVSLQQGTDFALSRLDTVYRNKQRVQAALEKVERELAQAGKGTQQARIWLSGKKARVSYLVSGEQWHPCYDFRWSGRDAKGELLVHARLPQPEKGVRYLVSTGKVVEGVPGQPVDGDFPTLSRHSLLLRTATRRAAVPVSFTFDPVEPALPPGEAAVYWGDEYLGSAPFTGGSALDLSAAVSTPLPSQH
jgi:hypothetical protein